MDFSRGKLFSGAELDYTFLDAFSSTEVFSFNVSTVTSKLVGSRFRWIHFSHSDKKGGYFLLVRKWETVDEQGVSSSFHYFQSFCYGVPKPFSRRWLQPEEKEPRR